MAYCTNCGAEEQEGQQFCGVCGARKPGVVGASPMPPLSSEGYRDDADVRVGISMTPPRQPRWTILL
ncbi:MAG TPA: zinc ribbon domain-containing protein, partial [Acidimicrobiales bacterium]|nr:zinc ribbon domain-containing protein [Acidimicrobiales bacterium]